MRWTPGTLIAEQKKEDKCAFRTSTPQFNCHNGLYKGEVVTIELQPISTRTNDMSFLVPLILVWSMRVLTPKKNQQLSFMSSQKN